jgi:hypothetical protein
VLGARPAAVLLPDADGYLVKQAAVARVPPHWRGPVDATVAMYAAQLGGGLHSVYVRGSIPLGEARDFVSDLDTFAIVTGPAPQEDVSWADEHEQEVVRRWPFVAGVEVSVHPLLDVPRSRRLAAMVKLLSACVHGEDLGPGIAGFRPGLDLLFHGWTLPGDAAIARRALGTLTDQAEVDKTCMWIAKRVVRSGFELVMRRAGCYTRDLVTCHELFARYHPRHATAMEEVLSIALGRAGDRARCLRAIDPLAAWLYAEICDQYGAARIEQLVAAATIEPRRTEATCPLRVRGLEQS